jgi:hypothetical protein
VFSPPLGSFAVAFELFVSLGARCLDPPVLELLGVRFAYWSCAFSFAAGDGDDLGHGRLLAPSATFAAD